ncbi:MAG TPA: hypothetical protein PLA01_00655 [Acetivibrio sp.]|nr:hypothetical protein [Acetivibrio sp.]
MTTRKMKLLSTPLIFALVFSLISITCFAAYITDTYIYLKWQANGGAKGFLGNAVTNTAQTPNKLGVYNHFEGGSIYRKNNVYEAYMVYGLIRNKWASLGWENSFLGFPLTDELETPRKDGRYNHFEGGSIYWKKGADKAYEVHGYIRSFWSWNGWETSQLGFPTSDEYKINGKQASRFENGAIYWKKNKDGSVYIWPMMSAAKGSQSTNGTKLIVTYYPVQFGTHVVITGSGFTPNKYVQIYLSRKYGPYSIEIIRVDSKGNLSYDSRQYGSKGCITNGNIEKVNGVITIWAQDSAGPVAIHSGYCYNVGNEVTLD